MKKYIIIVCTFFMTLLSCSSEIEDGKTSIDDLPEITMDEYTPSLEHPGILHNTKSIERMRAIVTKANDNDPAYQTYLLMKADNRAKSDYQIQGPFEYIARQDEYAWTKSKYEADFGAAYLNALMWVVTQEEAHARKVIEILTKYADVLKGIPNHNDAILLAGFHASR